MHFEHYFIFLWCVLLNLVESSLFSTSQISITQGKYIIRIFPYFACKLTSSNFLRRRCDLGILQFVDLSAHR
ncbi:hypothetical protein BD408DRAFT_409310 [Parasitella parasitica]|nr:hypothetical protein BD408DRAFT_409310 [Parasitella parasitica]